MVPLLPPGLSLPGLSSISTGPAVSGADSHSTLSTPISSPFVFDNSGWNVNVKGSGTQSAQGSSGAGAGAGGGGLLGGISPTMIALVFGLWLVLRH